MQPGEGAFKRFRAGVYVPLKYGRPAVSRDPHDGEGVAPVSPKRVSIVRLKECTTKSGGSRSKARTLSCRVLERRRLDRDRTWTMYIQCAVRII